MALTPSGGIVPLRYIQIGKETVFGTQVAATRRLGWNYQLTVDPQWTTPTGQTGTLDQAYPPYMRETNHTLQTSGEVYYNDAPNLWAILKAGVTGTTWTYTPASLTQDTIETFTVEVGDDVAGDQMAFPGSTLNSLTLEYPQDMGPVTHTADWRMSKLTYPSALTGALSVDTAPTPIFAGDTTLFIDSTSGGIGGTAISNAMYGATIQINTNNDWKYFANGNSTRFQAAGVSRGPREIQIDFTFAKPAAIITEMVNFLTATPVERFISLKSYFSAAYQQTVTMGGFWYLRTDGSVENNTSIGLSLHSRFNAAGLNYPIQTVLINTRSTL